MLYGLLKTYKSLVTSLTYELAQWLNIIFLTEDLKVQCKHTISNFTEKKGDVTIGDNCSIFSLDIRNILYNSKLSDEESK